MQRYKKFLIIFCTAITLFLVLTAALSLYERAHSGVPREIRLGTETLHLTLAVTENEKEVGLSGFSSLAADQGMLFIFESPDYWKFWMKDMHFPIDIIWLDQKGTIVSIAPRVAPETYPEIFSPGAKASYVLETIAGFSEKNNLKIGDRTEFLY